MGLKHTHDATALKDTSDYRRVKKDMKKSSSRLTRRKSKAKIRLTQRDAE